VTTDVRPDAGPAAGIEAAGDSPVDWAIAAPVRYWCARKPDATCIAFDGGTRTWQQVFDRAAQVAQALRALGAEPQDRVMYLGRNRPEFFELLVGASMAGVVTTAVNWRLSPRETQFILDNSQAAVLVVEDTFLDRIEQIRAELSSIRTVVVLHRTGSATGAAPADLDYDELLQRYPATDPIIAVGADEIGMQMYTSGTSGLPKGAMFSNRALRSNGPIARFTGVDEESVVLVAMPVFHASGASLGMLSMQFGAVMVLAQEVVPADLLRLIGEHRVTMTTLVPAVLKMMLETPEIATSDLSSLHTIAYAASPISPELLRAALATFGCRFLQIYGLTETNGAVALAPEDHLHPDHPERMLSAGRVLEGNELRIVDPGTGQVVADGEFGEVWIKAATSMSGYFGAAGVTSAAIDGDGWIGTGDGGYVLDGYLYLKDRIKDMIITGGENVYPVEVENALIEEPRVNDVAVIGVPSDRWGETIRAIVVRAPGDTSLSEEEVIAFARSRLARYKAPTSVVFVDELPRNPSGKILKRVLRE
jgi:long-chain acyl-CoA synthetase